MSKKEQNKITQLTSNGLINLDDENSLAQFDLLEGKFTLDPEETVIVDESKQPVYVSVTSRDEDGNETINTVWSEKANYIENLGEGLEITKEHIRDSKGNPVTNEHTYGVRLKVAGEGELGGIKLPEDGHLDINENGELDFDIEKIINNDDLHATNDRYGLVKIGDHLYFDEKGALTYDPFELPIANEHRVGGIKVGNGLKMTTDLNDGHKSILNVNSTAYRAHAFAQQNDDNAINFSNHPEVEQLSYIVDKILDYVQQLSIKYENCYNQLNTLMDYDPTVHGGILSGNGRFNGREGTHINFNDDIQQLFRHNGVTDYTVVLTQSSSILGDLGDYAVVKNKDKRTGFTVTCTGARNDIDEFTWILIPDTIGYSDEKDPDDSSKFYYQVEAFKKSYTDNNGLIKPMCIFDENRGLPIHHGHSSFRPNNEETEVSLPGGGDFFENGSTDYVVIITPTLPNGTRIEDIIDPSGAVIGEYCVSRKESDSFYVKCTGSLYYKDGEDYVVSNIGFDWVAIPYGKSGSLKEKSELVYDPAILPIRAGVVTSNVTEDIDGDDKLGDLHVNFGQTIFENRRYAILCQLMSDTGGQVGEYCGNFKDKLRDSFFIKYTGNVTYEDNIALKQFDMGWITVDKPVIDRVYVYKDEDNYFSVIVQFLDIDTGEHIYDEYSEMFEKGESYDFIYMVTDVKIPGYEFIENDGPLVAEKGSVFKDKIIRLKYKRVGDPTPVLVTEENKALVTEKQQLILTDPLKEE